MIPRTTTLLSAALVLAIAAAGYNYQRGERYRAKADAAEQQTAEMAIVLQLQNEVARKCAERTQELLAINQQQRAAIERQVAAVRESAQQLASARAELRAKEDADHGIPACENLLRTDLAVCPGHTAGVRNRAARSLQRSGGGSTPAGTNPDRPSTDG